MTHDKVTLPAELRTDFGKGAARTARREAKVPAVIYGHGAEPIHILLPIQETTLALRVSNALLTIDVEGETHLALVKDVQRHALRQTVDHLDLLTVKKGEKVTVDVTVHIEGEVAPGAVLDVDHYTVSVEADATNLPEQVTVNVDGREVGEHVLASDLVLPRGTELLIDADTVIATVDEPKVQDLGSTDDETATAGAEGEAASAASAE
ncbi:50S ribosomal protein L25/general stress protein Ctc [Arthrobacter rhombi]|uniref:50S ribosomal protein L25/general stress protein Ctc n=1 Tax=Arthrobacter rhombi TaxID=71253 RepID=UPI0031D7A830